MFHRTEPNTPKCELNLTKKTVTSITFSKHTSTSFSSLQLLFLTIFVISISNWSLRVKFCTPILDLNQFLQIVTWTCGNVSFLNTEFSGRIFFIYPLAGMNVSYPSTRLFVPYPMTGLFISYGLKRLSYPIH